MSATYRDGTEADLPAIDRLFRESFCDTFAHLYRAEDLTAFLAQFTPEAWRDEYDHGHYFRIAEVDGQVVGYVKLGPLMLPVETDVPALELRQIYVLKAHHGSGIARALMDWAIATARQLRARELYLTVYTDNPRARRVYDRYGFTEVGPYHFMVGEQADEDVIMRLQL